MNWQNYQVRIPLLWILLFSTYFFFIFYNTQKDRSELFIWIYWSFNTEICLEQYYAENAELFVSSTLKNLHAATKVWKNNKATDDPADTAYGSSSRSITRTTFYIAPSYGNDGLETIRYVPASKYLLR